MPTTSHADDDQNGAGKSLTESHARTTRVHAFGERGAMLGRPALEQNDGARWRRPRSNKPR